MMVYHYEPNLCFYTISNTCNNYCLVRGYDFNTRNIWAAYCAVVSIVLGTIIAEIAGKNNEKKKQEKTNSRFKI